ncbi:MAG TPA: methionyl-tRNA formyltransferase [Baekduia sp.]|uniref:methionyl-tRNA formyltransferase n=1 Tax=Baekduia sp. TaxID=2600305 RepID=UPI002BCEC1E0|nr:methionyl-tRNA formyltransferase [Baekduia sp.]HMJ35693.1 methionyl-tRNA formyltransferase [Baekduia sp.]
MDDDVAPGRGSEPLGELPPRNEPHGRGSLVYLGTSAFAAGVLGRLAEGPYRPALVVTRPDAKQGRGRKVGPPPVAVAARELGIEVDQPATVNDDDTRARIAAVQPDAVILCAFGALVKEPLLTDHDILNVHPSLLPRWRGAAPVERAMMAGDTQTGVSIMRLVAELDAGPVYAQRAEPILPSDDYAALAQRLQDVSVALLSDVLERRPTAEPQPEDGITYADKLTTADRTLDLTRPPEENVRIVRALHPHIGARIALPGDQYLGVLEATIGLDGGFEPVTVQPAGGRPMAYADYLRGHPPVL